MALSITLAGTTQVSLSNASFNFSDITGIQQPIQKLIPSLFQNMGNVVFGEATIGTTSVSVTLPASPTQLLYAKNLSASQTITITWTPQGATSAEVAVLQPNAMIFFFNPGAGITALSVVASAAGAVIDYVLAG
jgi:hypothetical protein